MTCQIAAWVQEVLSEPPRLECQDVASQSIHRHRLCDVHAFAVRTFVAEEVLATVGG